MRMSRQAQATARRAAFAIRKTRNLRHIRDKSFPGTRAAVIGAQAGTRALKTTPLSLFFDSRLLSRVLCFRYTPAMTKYEDIFDIAADNHGLITSAQAREAGITNNELVQYAKRGRVTKVGHGLYQLTQWVPEQNDAYAWAVMSVGPSAVLYGESVIAMLGLAPTNPTRTFVATPRRCRRALPESLKVEWVDGIEPGAIYDGIPCQSAYDAILACKGKMLPERLLTAAETARKQGFVSKQEFRSLKKELEGADVSKTAE